MNVVLSKRFMYVFRHPHRLNENNEQFSLVPLVSQSFCTDAEWTDKIQLSFPVL